MANEAQKGLRRRLLEEQKRLLVELDSVSVRPADDDRSLEDGLRRAEQERTLTLRMQMEAAVSEINHALRKVELGTYGVCDACGEPIPRERLAIRPQASHCVPCQHKRRLL